MEVQDNAVVDCEPDQFAQQVVLAKVLHSHVVEPEVICLLIFHKEVQILQLGNRPCQLFCDFVIFIIEDQLFWFANALILKLIDGGTIHIVLIADGRCRNRGLFNLCRSDEITAAFDKLTSEKMALTSSWKNSCRQ